MNRRTFLALFPMAPLVWNAGRNTIVVEASGASTYFAPYLVDRLTPGVPLSVRRVEGDVYLSLDGTIVGQLPDRMHSRAARASIVVADLGRDGDDRLRLFVALTGASLRDDSPASGRPVG